jgi:8-oxo-dGTP pyrophosphatase MutT (NUDIX family)
MFEQLKAYQPVNDQETADKALILQFLERNEDAFYRTNLAAHMTSSAIVVNKTMDKVLFAHHNIYQSYGWVGGHNDGDTSCLDVAIKEAKEETGIQQIYPYTNDIIGVDVIHVSNHYKNGLFVSDHLHLNITYLLIASETETPIARIEENSDVRWFDIKDVLDYVTEDRMKVVYQKLFKKIGIFL